MEYCYDVTEKDSFFLNWNTRYFQSKNIIVGITTVYDDINDWKNHSYKLIINSFNINTKEFTSNEKFECVDYVHIKNVDIFYEYITCNVVIDIINKQYSITNEFPYLISEIDGNHITECKLNDKLYVFHSKTYEYETGAFIFDIKNNTYNHSDFKHDENFIHESDSEESEVIDEKDLDDVIDSLFPDNELIEDNTEDVKNDEYGVAEDGENKVVENTEDKIVRYTNRFKNLHDKDITDCYVSNNIIFLSIDDQNDQNKVYKYDPITDNLTEIITSCGAQIKIIDNLLFERNWDHKVNIHDIESQKIISSFDICDKDQIVRHWDIYDNKLITICENYKNPYGQIYQESHDQECKQQNLKIVVFNIDDLII